MCPSVEQQSERNHDAEDCPVQVRASDAAGAAGKRVLRQTQCAARDVVCQSPSTGLHASAARGSFAVPVWTRTIQCAASCFGGRRETYNRSHALGNVWGKSHTTATTPLNVIWIDGKKNLYNTQGFRVTKNVD